MISDKMRLFNQNFNESKNDFLFLGIPILISVLVKLVLLIALWDSPINNDGITYINAAKQYVMGNFAAAQIIYPMPAYPLLLAFVHMAIPDWIITGYLISCISMILATIPLYYLTKTMFDRQSAFWACLVFAILPKMNEWSIGISRDPLFLFLFVSCIYYALKSISEKKLVLFGLTFILAWCATLIRIESVVFIGFYFCVLVYFVFFNKESRSSNLLKSLIWIGIPLGIVVIAFLSGGIRSMAVNRFDYVYGEIIHFFSGAFLGKSSQIYDSLSEIAAQKPFFDGHYSFITLCRHFLPLIYVLGIIQAIVKILFPLSFIPLYFGFKDKVNLSGFSGKFILWIWFLFAGIGYYLLLRHDFIATRWLMIPAVLLLPWVGLGLNRLSEKMSTSSYKKLFLALLVIIIIAPAVKSFRLTLSRDNTTVNTVQWLKDNDKINSTQIFSNDYKLAFYIDLKAEKNSKWKTHYYHRHNTSLDTKKIEESALNKNAQIVVIKVKTKHIDKIEEFNFFKKINSFVGNRYTILIYSRS